MSEQKRKRVGDHYEPTYKLPNQAEGHNHNVVSPNPILQQPIIINPVVAHGEQFAEAEQVQLVNGTLATNQNGQSNLVYIILPPGVSQSQNVIQGVPAFVMMQKGEQVTTADSSPPQLHYYVQASEKTEPAVKNDDDVIIIKDVRSIKGEDQQICTNFIADPDTDPLQINPTDQANNVSYTIVPQYEEIQHVPTDDVFILDSANLQQVQPVETPVTSADSMKWKSQFKCDYPGCMVTFPSLYEKKIHAETHIFPASSEFKCSICNMMFDRAADRNKHVDSHAVVSTYRCKTCRKTFPYYTSLVKHMNEEKCYVSKTFSCHFCGVQFVDADDLEKHQKLNMKLCPCRAKICSDQAFELHTSLCVVYKQKMGKMKTSTSRKSKKSNSGDVIVLD